MSNVPLRGEIGRKVDETTTLEFIGELISLMIVMLSR
jgi:hypothetical protein